MSRVGAMPIEIPEGIQVDVEGDGVVVSSKSGGSVAFKLGHGIKAVLDNKTLVLVNGNRDNPRSRVMWGSYRSNINNAVRGLHEGFTVEFEVTGVGYKVAFDGKKYLSVYLGYSHGVKYAIPDGVTVKCTKPTQFSISGSDRAVVCMVASDICSIRKYDPYKGKGISIKGKYVYRKEVTKKK